VARVPASTRPLDAIVGALADTGELFEARRDFARHRHALIVTHAELHERELIKLASLATALAEALRRRGVRDPAASLAAEAGMTIFKRAFEAWVGDGKKRDLAHHVRVAHAELEGVVGGKREESTSRRTGLLRRPRNQGKLR
jgi:hypothetical protein